MNRTVETWDDQMPVETLSLMFEEAKDSRAFLSQWADALDAKTVAAFTAGSILITAVPAVGGIKAHGWEWIPWAIAIGAWLIVGVCCVKAFRTREFLVGPNPSALLTQPWLDLTPSEYRFYRLQTIGNEWKRNTAIVNIKATALGVTLPAVAIETAALLMAIVLQAVDR